MENEKKVDNETPESKAGQTSEEQKKDGDAAAETGTSETDGGKASKADESVKEESSEHTELKTSEEKIAELERQIEDLKKEALYKAAENDNWRKRMMQQKDEAVAYANANLLSDLLDSLDNFDRTVEAAKGVKEAESIVDGIKMINKSLVSMLENKYELVGYGKEGDSFDPDLHEAIGMQEGDVEEEKLAAVYLKGYKLKDRVIRHAKVMVVKPKEK